MSDVKKESGRKKQMTQEEFFHLVETGQISHEKAAETLKKSGMPAEEIAEFLKLASTTSTTQDHTPNAKTVSKPTSPDKKGKLRIPSSNSIVLGAVALLVISALARFGPGVVSSTFKNGPPPIPPISLPAFPFAEPTKGFIVQPTSVPNPTLRPPPENLNFPPATQVQLPSDQGRLSPTALGWHSEPQSKNDCGSNQITLREKNGGKPVWVSSGNDLGPRTYVCKNGAWYTRAGAYVGVTVPNPLR